MRVITRKIDRPVKIAFVICGNGYGHLKRVCDVVSEIFKIDNSVSIRMLGASHHGEMLGVWNLYRKFADFDFQFINAQLERNLQVNIVSSYTFDNYLESYGIVRREIDSFQPERIVSDNLAGILNYYPAANLMGSFLWCDILPDVYPEHEGIKRICKFEGELLTEKRPALLGVDDMVMKTARDKTTFVGLPWFCSKAPREPNISASPRKILIAGGGTGKASQTLLEIAVALCREREFDIAVDRSLHIYSQRLLRMFDFAASSFSSLDCILCRPGMGILTDAVKYGVPICVVDDVDPEMKHNAARVEALGIGIRIKKGDDISTLFRDRPEQLALMQSKLSSLQTGGALKSAKYILSH